MDRMLRISLCTGLLLWGVLLLAQEPALMNGAQAVRFEQSPGFFHYVVFCKTPKEFTTQIPPAKLPPDSMEYGFCWYVRGTVSRGNAVLPEADGRLVISPHHVRFIPGNPQLGNVYADLHPEQVELKHDPGQPHGILQSNGLVFRFQFSKLCLTCAPGTPTPPGVVPALADQEFALLDETIRHFYSGWKQIYRLSSGKRPESQSAKSEVARGSSPDPSTNPKPAPSSAPAPSPSDPGPIHGEEATVINGEPGVRFEQSPGFYHYATLCRTAKGSPAPSLPRDATESAVCWYVRGSKTSAGGNGSPEVDGKLVISGHHVRFLPRNPEFAAAYSDLPPEQVALKHEPGQAYATLQSKGFAFVFRFSKLCLSCAPGTPATPGFVPALLDQEFALLDAGIRHFDSAWQQIHQLTSEGRSGKRSANQPEIAPAAAPASSETLAASRPPLATAMDVSLNSRPASPAAMKASPNIERTKPPIRIAPGAANGLLVKKVAPAYPLEAKLVRLEGTVIVRAVIEKTGDVAEVYALSGPPLLESAAVDAVKQWQYRPYSHNGQPVDVETTIDVVFALDGSHAVTRARNMGK